MATQKVCPPDPKLPAARTRAYRLGRLDPEAMPSTDRKWLADYQSARAEKRTTERIIHVEERNDEEAIAVGDAAEGGALLAKAEGERIDSLLRLVTDGFSRCLEYHEAMSEMVITRMSDLMASQAALVDALATTKLQSADAEAKAIIAQATMGGDEEGDAISHFIRGFGQGMGEQKKAPKPRAKKPRSAQEVRDAINRARERRGPKP